MPRDPTRYLSDPGLLILLHAFLRDALAANGDLEQIGHDDYRMGYRAALKMVQRWLEENSR